MMLVSSIFTHIRRIFEVERANKKAPNTIKQYTLFIFSLLEKSYRCFFTRSSLCNSVRGCPLFFSRDKMGTIAGVV